MLGFSADNADPDGRAVTQAYLRYLAHHPATARRIAAKLALPFVSDEPSAELVSALARSYRLSGTDISATLRTLAAHPELLASAGKKLRNPIEDFLATVRALGVTAQEPTASDAQFARVQV